ncbi:flagellum-associated coiled-coil domain-containing protein 1-like isoform X2 [Littorina saxatilis]|uniref:flagellum-associated coiled-coil domain-containing protein 1-like isoform X2 n=1 Tax=Littorina saxatilis TaxID=31220 RepID=UPI0038B5DBBF
MSVHVNKLRREFHNTMRMLEDKRGVIIHSMSTPVNYHRTVQSVSPPAKIHRPKTAAAILGRISECDRVHQLEHEPTRCHNLESHLPTKRSKPPPWQKHMEQPLVPFVVGPGYILSRSKTKYAVTLKDEFFETTPEAEQKKKQGDDERDSLTAQLQQQISDLTLYLEEERLNHRQTKQRAEEYLRDRLDQAHAQHQEHIRELQNAHREEILKQKAQHEADFSNNQTITENQIHKLSKEVEFLQGAFESYKCTLQQEMGEKWKTKEEDLKREFEEAKNTVIHEMKTQLIKERNSERSSQAKDHHRQIDALRKEHKKELDALIRRFSNAAADIERSKKTTAELEETKAELQQIKERYDETCQQLANTTRNLTDTKVRLMDFEQRFQEKVVEVDDKYRLKLQDLMTQNTELKRLYVQKCGQLFDEKEVTATRTRQEVQTAKEAMESLIRSKARANVSVAMTPEVYTPHRSAKTKMRPSSAPGTRLESEIAHWGAGDTDHLIKEEEFFRPDNVIPPEDPETERIRQELLATNVREITKEDLLNTFVV